MTQIALFIDYENIVTPDFEPEELMDLVREQGRIAVARAYADWGRYGSDKHALMQGGVELVEVASRRNGKNSADIYLVLDAFETATVRPHIDTYIIVSGDSDMIPLVQRLRAMGRYVKCIARRESLSGYLTSVCDEVITLRGEFATSNGGDVAEAFAALSRVLEAQSGDGNAVHASSVKGAMLRLDPTFSEKSYGYGQFRDFLEAARQEGICLLARDSDEQLTVRPASPTRSDAASSTRSEVGKRAELLAAIRKQNCQFLGKKRQRQVLDAFFGVMTELGDDTTRSDLSRAVFEALEDRNYAAELSRTKVNGVLQLAMRGGAFRMHSGGANDPSTVAIGASVSSKQDLYEAHDRGVYDVLKAAGYPADLPAIKDLLVS